MRVFQLRRDLVLAFELDEDVRRPAPIQLHRQSRLREAQRIEKLALPLEGLALANGLLHPSEDGTTVAQLELHGDEPGAGLERDVLLAERRADDECRSEHGMTGERHLRLGGKDPNPDVSAFARWEQKDRLGEVHLSRQTLHLLRRERPTVDEDAKLISLQRLGGEDVADEGRMQLGRAVPSG